MHYRQVIDFREPAIQMKVHQTYRLQYLKDVVLARVLDDPTFGVLNSFIIFNQIDIVNYIQNEEYFLAQLFGMFHPAPRPSPSSSDSDAAMKDVEKREEASEDRKAAALLLLHQFCSIGKNVQLPMRMPLFRSLVDRGVLFPVQWAFEQTDVKIRSLGGEILTILLDHDSGGIRGHILRQHDQGQLPTLLQRMSTMLASPLELGFRTQLAESYRTLMDVPGADMTNVSASSDYTTTDQNSPSVPSSSAVSGLFSGFQRLERFLKSTLSPSTPPLSPSPPSPPPGSPNTIPMPNPPPSPPHPQLPGLKIVPKKEEAQSEKFVDYFYKNCAETLFKPLAEVSEHKDIKG